MRDQTYFSAALKMRKAWHKSKKLKKGINKEDQKEKNKTRKYMTCNQKAECMLIRQISESKDKKQTSSAKIM